VAILLGNGAGGFSEAANSPLSTGSDNPGAVSVGDFNEDGKRDLALPGTFGVLSILLGDGTGGFAAGVNTTTNGSTLSFLVADFNEDTHLDVLMGNRMVPGTGTGSFGAPTTVAIPADSGAGFAIDVNNDSHLDVVVASISGLTIVLGNGTGALFPGKSYASGFTIFGAGSAFAVPGDFNEDGKIDLAAVQRRGVGILDGDGTGAFNDALSYAVSVANPNYLVAADFNNDGKQDFATLSPNTAFPNGSKLEVALGDGNGGFTQKSVSNFFISPPAAIATADFNGDGKLDMAVTQPSNGRVSILLNDGTGGFQVDGFNAPNLSVGFKFLRSRREISTTTQRLTSLSYFLSPTALRCSWETAAGASTYLALPRCKAFPASLMTSLSAILTLMVNRMWLSRGLAQVWLMSYRVMGPVSFPTWPRHRFREPRFRSL
jgi:hypothetical protein